MGGTESSRTIRRGDEAMALLRYPFSLLFGLSGQAAGTGFSAATTFLRFPGPGFGKAPALDPPWFDEAEFVVLERTRAGVVTLPLTIEEFPVPAN